MNLIIFLFSFLVITGLFAAYITWRLFGKSHLHRFGKIAAGAAILGIFFITPITIILRRSGMESGLLDMTVWVGYVGLGFLSFVFTLLLIRDIIWMPSKGYTLLRQFTSPKSNRDNNEIRQPNAGRRRFIAGIMNYGIVSTAAILTGYGYVEAKQIPDVKEVVIPLNGLPPEFDGFKIVQITDIHVSPTIGKHFVAGVVEVVNRLKGDMVVLTGDLVDGSVSRLSAHVEPLSRITAPAGNYFVTGNHEYYSGAAGWINKVKSLGFDVLLNEHRIIRRGSSRVVLAGVTDFRAGSFYPSHRSDPHRAIAGVSQTDVKILLAHQPKNIFAASKAGFDLQLSGHTHGGQFFPWNFLVELDQPFLAGLHRFENAQIYVSRGTGYWGPPVRVGSPSEITLIRLVNG